MSPTVFRYRNYRFFFFSREEERMHIHVSSPGGDAKFWLEPVVALAHHHGLSAPQILQLQRIVSRRIEEIRDAWKDHFKSGR